MKFLHIIVFSFLISLAAFSCAENVTDNSSLATIADPQNVKILYKYSFNNELNTFAQKLTKDLVLDGTITVDFWLTDSEQMRILEMADQIGFFDMPDSLSYKKTDPKTIYITPILGVQSLKIKFGNKGKEIFWNLPNSFPQEYAKLQKLTSLIEKIIKSKKEFKDLPAARGRYC
ncbi:MAG: hypothetical protein Q8933_16930 [Bacteroidota bacterium]|nr:hypothetical protein [Bacteroidota bacterium]